MKKIYEKLTMVFFMIGLILLVSAAGNIELDYTKTGVLCMIFGIISMMLCLVCQQKQNIIDSKKYESTYKYYMKNTKQ